MAEQRGEEAGSVGVTEMPQLPEVDGRGVEDPRDRQERQRDHRQQRERRREHGSEAQPADGGDREQQQTADRDPERPPRDRRVDRGEAGGRELQAVDDVERRQDHVERRHREPPEPVGPGGEAVHVLGEPRPFLLIGRIRIRGQAAGTVGHHRRELREQQAHDVATDRDHDDHRDARSAQLGHHHRRDPGDQDRPCKADYECAPPVRGLRQTGRFVDEFVVFRRGAIRHVPSRSELVDSAVRLSVPSCVSQS